MKHGELERLLGEKYAKDSQEYVKAYREFHEERSEILYDSLRLLEFVNKVNLNMMRPRPKASRGVS